MDCFVGFTPSRNDVCIYNPSLRDHIVVVAIHYSFRLDCFVGFTPSRNDYLGTILFFIKQF
ncbi:hypothetical protein [Candidatus Tisiphia endosymbiont of Hybos culiciformis]|uniref:hypothetical protein n=1 Tax=Candidatus Tisiphia endosymbiont of Hybos culiciformis TaxID=3139331 RepID=UPI003CCAC97A